MKNYLKMYLAREGMSQKKLAEEFGVSVQQVSKWVNGHHAPGLETALKIAKLLNTTVDEIWSLE